MDTISDSSKRKRSRSLFQEAPDQITHLRLKHMEESLKSRIGCEIQAFCSNFESLVFRDESVSQTAQRSPPQTVPDRGARVVACAFPPTISEAETSQLASDKSIGDVTASIHSESTPSQRPNSFEEEREMEYLVVRLMELALKLNNSLMEKGL